MKIKTLIVCFAVGAGTVLFSLGASAQETLTWTDCIKEAQKNHPDLISAQEGVKQQEAGKKITASILFPQLDSSVSVDRAKTGTTTGNSYSYGVNGSQLLFDGLKTFNNVKVAAENIKAAQYNFRFTSGEVRWRLRTAFVNLLEAQESLTLSQEILKIRKNDLELITLRYESGSEHKGALLTAQANFAQADFNITQAQRALEVSQQALLKEMGRPEFSAIQAAGDFKVSNVVTEKPDFPALAQNNPSIEKLIAQQNAALFGIKAAQANFYPQLSAQAGADRSGSHWPPESNQWNVGLSMSLPLFEGGLRQAQVSQAKAVFNQAQANERSSKDAVILALQQTWAALQDGVAAVDVQQKFLAAAEERANIAEAQYSLGLLLFDNWTIIQDDLVRAKLDFLNAQANALLAEANWIHAKGETLEYAQ